MASEAFLDSCYRMALRCMATANVAGDMMQKEGLVHDVAASDVNASASTTTSDSSVVQQESYESQKRVQASKRKQQQGTSQASLPKKKKSTIDPIEKELSDSTQTQIGNTLETKQDAFLQQQAMQHLLQQNSGSLQSQVCIPVLDNSSQQRGSGDMMQRRTFQTAAHLPGVDLKQQQLQQEKQVKEYLQQLALRRAQPAPQLFNGDICYRRLMQYMYHLQHRPSSNDLCYWRKFVAEYFAPCAKKRWCLSSCDSLGRNAVGVSHQAAKDAWLCDLCGSTSGKGFEATYEVLPRLNKIQFETGVTDELLYLDFPQERRLPSGSMVLEYGKAVHKTVYNQFHVAREGKLRIIFTRDLKISSWEFCSKEHEELLPRSLVLSQVNDFVRTAQQYQNAIDRGGQRRTPNLRESCNVLLSAGCNFGRSFESQLAGDIGFPKRYIRCLQIAEIVNSMKDLMTFSCQNKIGAIESLKTYAEKSNAQKPTEETDLLTKNDQLSKGKGRVFTTAEEEAALADSGSYVKLLSRASNQNVAGSAEPSYLGSQISVPEYIRNAPSSNYYSSDSSIIQEHIMKLLQRANNNSQNTCLSDSIAGLPTTLQNMDAYSTRTRLPTDHSPSASSWESSSACADPSFINKGNQPDEYEAYRRLLENGLSDGSFGDSTSFSWKG